MTFDWVNGGGAALDEVVQIWQIVSNNKAEVRSTINNRLLGVYNYSYKPTSSAAQIDINAVDEDGDSIKGAIALQFVTNSGGIFFGTTVYPDFPEDGYTLLSGGFIME